MLVISRKVGESIVIGDSIVVTVVQTQRGRVRLGVEAPPGVLILREELHARRREAPAHLPFKAHPPAVQAQAVETGAGD
jgi:carbon storage regulator